LLGAGHRFTQLDLNVKFRLNQFLHFGKQNRDKIN
jgi:hypothetical protein